MSVRKKQSDILTTRAPERLSLEQVLAVGVRKMALGEVKLSETLYTTGGTADEEARKREREGVTHYPEVVSDLDNFSNHMHTDPDEFKRARPIEITPEPEPEPEPKTEDNLVLWNGTHELCTNWNNDNDALGVRNIYAAFYLIAKIEAKGMKSNTVPEFMKCFPKNEEWFNYKERFLAIYCKQYLTEKIDWSGYRPSLQDTPGPAFEELRLTDTCTEFAESESVEVATLPGRAVDNCDKWTNAINRDCKKYTDDKIEWIVGGDDLYEDAVRLVILAAENVKMTFKHKFDVTDSKEHSYNDTFYGTTKQNDGKWAKAEGKCHIMGTCERYISTWSGNKCTAAFIKTTTPGLYFVAVLPTKDRNEESDPKYTTQKEMEEAAEEIKNNCVSLLNVVDFGEKYKDGIKPNGMELRDVFMPRVKRYTQPVNVMEVCGGTRLGDKLARGQFGNIAEKREVTDNNPTFFYFGEGQWEESRITPKGQWKESLMNINKLMHATYLNVNEFGAEVAAATAPIIYTSIGTEEPPEPLRFNRGYLIYVMDFNNDTPHVLYYARITNDECLKNAPPGDILDA